MAKWNDAMSVGVAEIDRHHMDLIAALDTLQEQMKNKAGAQQVEKTLKFLDDYVVKHFGFEETSMVKHSYPQYIPHKKIHDDFKKDLYLIKRQLEEATSKSTVTIKLSYNLSNWLVNHIMTVDKELGKYLVAQGVK